MRLLAFFCLFSLKMSLIHQRVCVCARCDLLVSHARIWCVSAWSWCTTWFLIFVVVVVTYWSYDASSNIFVHHTNRWTVVPCWSAYVPGTCILLYIYCARAHMCAWFKACRHTTNWQKETTTRKKRKFIEISTLVSPLCHLPFCHGCQAQHCVHVHTYARFDVNVQMRNMPLGAHLSSEICSRNRCVSMDVFGCSASACLFWVAHSPSARARQNMSIASPSKRISLHGMGCFVRRIFVPFVPVNLYVSMYYSASDHMILPNLFGGIDMLLHRA